MRNLVMLGPCRPDRWLKGCKSPVEAEALARLVNKTLALPFTDINIVGHDQIDTFHPSVPDELSSLAAFVVHSDSDAIGMLHWRDLSTIIFRTSVLMKVLTNRDFAAGQKYPELVKAINKLGLYVLDLNFD